MEFLEGQTLRDRLQLVGAMPVREAVATAAALCDALSFAHSRGVIHRDIKPENVHLLTDGRVKLTDFGIARIVHETQLTVAGQVFGTPSYMSPEQVLGKDIDHRSDIFSLGVLLFEMVTGRRPFTYDSDSVVTITYRIMNDPTPPAVGVSPILNSVIQRATAKNPADRFQTATEFGTTLLAAGQTSPVVRPETALPMNPAAQRTIAYGQQTQGGIPPALSSPDDWARQSAGPVPQPTYGHTPQTGQPAPVLSANLPPAMPPVAPATPATNNNNGRLIAIVAIILVMVLIIVLGAFLGVRAYNNFLRDSNGKNYLTSYSQAAKLYHDARYEEAAALFRQTRLSGMADPGLVRRSAEGEVYSYRKLGQQAQDRSDFLTAQRWFNEALKVSPDDPQAKQELDAVQKRLAGQSAATPAPAIADNAVPSATPSAPPRDVPMPGSISTNEFVDANNRAGMQAAQLLQQGTEAYQKGDTSAARRLWLEAVSVGPGSQAALQAQEFVIRLNQNKDPFGSNGS
jgi:serine/threonine-protein kinase